MVGSRHLFGTVLTRVRNLLQSGALAKKPVWFDVVEAFPPLVETKVKRKPQAGRANKVTYPEDEFRNKFHSTLKTKEPLNLFEGIEHKPNSIDRFVAECQSLVDKGKDSDTAFEEVVMQFKQGQVVEEKSKEEQNEDIDSTKPVPNILEMLKDHQKNNSPNTNQHK